MRAVVVLRICSFVKVVKRLIAAESREAGRGFDLVLTTFNRPVNCDLVRFPSTPLRNEPYEHELDYPTAPRNLRHSRFCVRRTTSVFHNLSKTSIQYRVELCYTRSAIYSGGIQSIWFWLIFAECISHNLSSIETTTHVGGAHSPSQIHFGVPERADN